MSWAGEVWRWDFLRPLNRWKGVAVPGWAMIFVGGTAAGAVAVAVGVGSAAGVAGKAEPFRRPGSPTMERGGAI